MTVPKQLVAGFIDLAMSDIERIDYDAISLVPLWSGCSVGQVGFLAASDNDNQYETYMTQFCMSYSSPTPQQTLTPTIPI